MLTTYRLLLLNFGLAAYLTGLIWVVQLVVYPALAGVGRAEFGRYHAAHTQGMGYAAGPAMVLELLAAGWLAWVLWPASKPLALSQLALALATWAATFGVAVPFHNRLAAQGYNYVAIDGLTRTNWLRTLAWTARAALLAYALAAGPAR